MMKEALTRVKGSVVATGIASIVLGILFLCKPVLAGFSICYFIGGLLVIAGIAKTAFSFASPLGAAQSIVGGVLLFLFGLLCLYRPDIIAELLTLFAGIFVIADGTVALSEGIFCVRCKVSGGVAVVVMSLILIVCGFFVMFAPISFIMQLAGVVLVADGIFDLVLVAVMSKRIADAKQVFED